jgi:hypothetical protein
MTMTVMEPRGLVDEAPAPVFVHSGWRTGSTWLWEKLRRAPTTIAYCEVFHERLAHCDIRDLRDNDFSKWKSKHPEGAPYFLEFGPLIGANRAVRGYAPSMAVEDFMPRGGVKGDLSEAERGYLAGLIDNARRRQRIPVLTDTRTLGRFPAIARAFSGRHVLLIRNIFHQWASYSEQWADGNPYFFAMQWKTIEAARRDPFVALLAEWFDRGEKTPQNPAAFQLFLLFHLYLYGRAHDFADFILDLNAIASDPEARATAEAALGAFTRSPIDLSDVRPAFGLSLFQTPSKASFVDSIDQFAKQAIDGSVSAEAAAFVMRLKDEALLEWERCEFYSGSYVARSGRRVAEAKRAWGFAEGESPAFETESRAEPAAPAQAAKPARRKGQSRGKSAKGRTP